MEGRMEDKRDLVIIGVPCGDRVHQEFAQCLWGAGRGARNHRQGIAFGNSSIVANARNQCVEAALHLEAQWLMFIDSDMMFPHTTIDRLLAHKKDIVCGVYPRRGPPFDNLGHTINEEDRFAKTGLVEMSHVPTGMLLINTKVFADLKRPFFRFGADETHGIVRGEDWTFSEMARERGYSLWADIDLSKELRHIYQYQLSVEDPATRKMHEAHNDQRAA